MTTTDPTAGPQIVSGDHDEAAAHHDAMLREIESLRSQLAEAREALVRVAKTLGWDAPPEQVPSGIPDLTIAVQQLRHERDQARGVLAEARQQRDQAAEALVRAETERDEAREAQVQHATAMAAIEIIDDLRAVLALSPGQSLTKAVTQLRDDLAWLRRQVLAVAEDLERYASDPRPERLPMSERKLAWTLRQIVAGDRPETAPESPQTGEQTGVRVETCTEPASARVDLVIGLRQRGIPQHPDGPEAAALAEIDRLRTEAAMLRAEREWLADRARTMGIAEAIIAAHGPAHAVSAEAGRLRAEVKQLSARVREWEAVNADLAARCDSGDIPTRLGERYSQAVLREIDRLRTERDRLLDELPEDNTIAAAVRGLRAARSATPDTMEADRADPAG